MVQIKRETASICQAADILNGDFVKADGWNPSYFSTELGNISRVNFLGVLISKDPDGLLFDDGSGRIRIRNFEGNAFDEFKVGELVLVIGRPRMYNEQKYILPEIIKQTDPVWAEFRKKQIELLKRTKKVIRPKKEDQIQPTEKIHLPNPIGNNFQKIMDFVKDLDNGEGASTDEVIVRSSIPNANDLIYKLIEEGEIFEIKPGRLKLLE
jgi:RPA family protein